MRIEVSRYVFAPAHVAWSVLTDWERQADWMVDARSVEVVAGDRDGTGVRLVCPTRLLGVTVRDEMEVIERVEDERLTVRHLGPLIHGTGTFELRPGPVGTHVVWRERIEPPLGTLGELAGRLVVRPYLRRLFARSLDGLKAIVEREARRERVAGAAG